MAERELIDRVLDRADAFVNSVELLFAALGVVIALLITFPIWLPLEIRRR